MHRPYCILYDVEVKERGKEPRMESRVAHVSARNPANAQRRLSKMLRGSECVIHWPEEE